MDPWAHFCNAYVLDRNGNRIDRRNVEDIFVPLYDHQIPPGAADVVHYRLRVPEGLRRARHADGADSTTASSTPTYLRQVQGDGVHPQ